MCKYIGMLNTSKNPKCIECEIEFPEGRLYLGCSQCPNALCGKCEPTHRAKHEAVNRLFPLSQDWINQLIENWGADDEKINVTINGIEMIGRVIDSEKLGRILIDLTPDPHFRRK